MFIGNRLTENAHSADDGEALIKRALEEIASETGWRRSDDKTLFKGNYYDSKKVGSLVVRVSSAKGEHAVLKIQLRSLPYDEGMIFRHISPRIKTSHIRLPWLFADIPWNEERGYGYLITEDASNFVRLWKGHSPTEDEMKMHASFLDEFMHHVLPMEPFLPMPDISVKEKYREALDHFSKIAKASDYCHVDEAIVDDMKERYLQALERTEFGEFHFTHGHLSGMDIRIDPKDQSFVLFSNLLWSYRPEYYEVVFPAWVDCMGIRDIGVNAKGLMERVNRWMELWYKVMGEDLRENRFFRFLILERSMMTVMLDLGASEWKEDEVLEKEALLKAWTGLFEMMHSDL